MTDMFQHLLSAILFSPLVGFALLFVVPASQPKLMRSVAFLASLVPLALSILLFTEFKGTGDYEFVEVAPWLQEYSVFYRIGVDGFSMPLVILSTLLIPLVILSSWNDVTKQVRGYLSLLLLIETGMVGVFVAMDVFLFYVFWEAQLIPMYFLIGIWGGKRRVYASIKFVLFTMAGSLLMLAAILYLYFMAGQSFDIREWSALPLGHREEIFLFLAFTLAFIIKIPLFPFHTWLPDAHVEAPTGGSVILAGVLLKMGTYGLIRYVLPIFPQATMMFLPTLQILAVIGIIYGSLIAMVQTDIKKAVAYTSVSHMGFIVLGLAALNAQGIAGAGIQMLNHGISTGALFLLVGMIYERRHTREISAFGGIAKVMPIYTVLFITVTVSSIGLPMTNGFVGEFLILLGSFKEHPVLASLATTGVIFGAVAMLKLVQNIFFGPMTHEANKSLQDVSMRELILILPLIVFIFWIGMAPGFIMDKMNPSVQKLTEKVTNYGKSSSN